MSAIGKLKPTWLEVGGVGALLAAAVACVFHSAHAGAFLSWDDDINIVGNTHLRGLTLENVKWMFTDADYMRRYAPLAWLNWCIDHQLFGLTARSCHIGNIVIHVANAILVFALLRRVLQVWFARRAADDGDGRSLLFAAAVGAVVWALHPLRVEVVAWASGRIYGQGMFFLLAALVAYLEAYLAERASDRRRYRVWLALAVISYAASLLTYPIALTFVPVLIVMDVYLLRRFQPNTGESSNERKWRVWLEKLPFLAVAAVIGAVTVAARWRAQGLWESPPSLAEFGLFDRVMQAGYVLGYYVWRPWIPVGLAPVYTTLVEFNPRDAVFVASVLGVIAITLILVWQRERWPGWWALWLVHLIVLVPMLGLTERPHYTNDRYSYAQGLVWSVAIAAGILHFESRVRRGVALAGVGTAVVACSVISTTQIGIWRDNETLFRYLERAVTGPTYRADISMRLGDTLRVQGRILEAAQYYRNSLRLVPNRTRSAIPHFGLAKIAQAQGQLDIAVAHYSAAAALQPEFAEAHLGLGEMLLAKRELPPAVICLTTAAKLMPAHADVRDLFGVALFESGRYGEAIAEFEAAIRLSPTYARAHYDYAAALLHAGRTADAIRESEVAVKLAPNSAAAYARLGAALRANGRLPEAVSALQRSVDLGTAAGKAGGLSSDRAAVYLDLGLALRDTGRHAEAVEALVVATRLDPERATARDELSRLQAR